MSEVVTERDKLRNVVRKLKDDRTHYRTVAEGTQESLATVQEHLESEKMNKSGVVKELEVLREKHQNEMTAIDHARKLASRKSLVFTPEREKQLTAASTLQHHWKRRQSTIKQRRFEEEREQAVLHLQSALRGHMARRQMVEGTKLDRVDEPIRRRSHDIELSESSGSEESDASDAVETIQSAMRGYMARQMAMKDLNRIESRAPSSPPVPVVSIGDLWKDGATVSSLVGYQPPHTSHTIDSTHNRSVTKGNSLSEDVGPWRACAEMSDGDTPPLVPSAFLRLNHSHSSSTISLVDSPGEKSLLIDEF